MKVKIYQPAKSSMQSGKAHKKWLLEPIEEQNPRSRNGLMGWVSTNSMNSELSFYFTTKEEAIDFAKESNFEYEVLEPARAVLQKKSYADNFA